MVKEEKNKWLNVFNNKLNFHYRNKKFILPNKGFKKFSLDSNKV
jgi:hypothetical protein